MFLTCTNNISCKIYNLNFIDSHCENFKDTNLKYIFSSNPNKFNFSFELKKEAYKYGEVF